MNKGVALIGGVGLGAALMYVFDPDRGKRRRALLRDKVEAAGNRAVEKAEKMRRDIGNRAYGVVAETKSIFRHDEVSDGVLVDRVRSRLGRIPVHVGAFDISAHEGTVTLKGQILAAELPEVLRATRFVRGVKAVDNQFQVHQAAGNVPDLQGQPQPLVVG
jgi:osmotically-inducible protein OsmY